MGQYQVVTNQGISQAFIEKQKDPAKAWRDDMNKIRDDPLLAIKQAEKKQREKIMDNPLKIKQFKEVCHFTRTAHLFPLLLAPHQRAFDVCDIPRLSLSQARCCSAAPAGAEQM